MIFACNFYNSFAIDCPNTFKHIYGDSILTVVNQLSKYKPQAPGSDSNEARADGRVGLILSSSNYSPFFKPFICPLLYTHRYQTNQKLAYLCSLLGAHFPL